MQFICNFCLSPIQHIKSEYLGRKIKCPHCNQKMVLPSYEYGAGRIIGDFIISSKIGEGSIGTVFLAKQRSLDRNVALKILSSKYTTEKGISSFLSEARIAAKLNHPSIVQVLFVGEDNGICFMAMNYIQGKTVRQKIDDHDQIPVDESLHIIQQVAEALHFAWEQEKMIHRDIKPENIIITMEGAVKLTDLGLAIQASECRKGMEISGTPFFMSPEQFAGEKLDTRTDIYSLGITLYQMLAGRLPYDGETLNTVAKQHFYEQPESIKNANPSVSDEVENLVAKMIAKHPDDRFQNMEELLNQIWIIRQTTAPNKDMIPGVHTISIKKLDYKVIEPPKPAYRTGKPVAPSSPKVKSLASTEEEEDSFNVSMKFIGACVAIIVTIIFVILLVYVSKSKKISQLESEMELIEKNFYETNMLNMQTEEDCMNIIAKTKNTEDPREKNVQLRARLVIAELKNKKNISSMKTFATELETLKKGMENKDNSVASTHERELAKVEVLKTIESEKLKADLENEKIKAKSEKESLQKQLEETLKNVNEQKKKDEEYKQNIFYAKLYSLVRQYKFPEVSAALDEFSQKGVLDQKKSDNLKERIQRFQTYCALLSKSGNKFYNITTPDGTVIKISDGIIEFNDKGALSSKKWYSLPVETLYAILSENVSGQTENKVKAEISLLIGNPEDAIKYAPDDQELKIIIDSSFNSNMDTLKSLASSSKKKAMLKLMLLQKEFGNIPKYKGQLDELKLSLEKNSTPSTEDE